MTLRSEFPCSCSCHTMPGVWHIAACCSPSVEAEDRTRRPVCPECVQGKHAGCSHMGGVDEFDEIVDCACGCEPSRTCPQCSDVVPVGFTLDVHLNCNYPEER